MGKNEIEDSEMPQTGASKFLKGIDVKGKIVQATIEAVGESTFESNGESKSVRTLDVDLGKDGVKSFSLNKTNIATLVAAYGRGVQNWVGKRINLTSTVKNNPKTGQPTDSIMIIAG